MPDSSAMPTSIREAHDLVCSERTLDDATELQAVVEHGDTSYRFEYTEHVACPNRESVPEAVRLRVDIPETFPFDPPKVYSLCPDVQGFPHQDAETGKLCLFDDSVPELNEGRLLTYVGWTKEWLEDAAKGLLLQPGDPYELPDFSRRKMLKEVTAKPTLFAFEDEGTWGVWRGRIGQIGTVDFKWLKPFKGILPARFRDAEKNVIAETDLAEGLIDKRGIQIDGVWTLLESLCYVRHRPPQTYGEVAELCQRSGIALQALLRSAWSLSRDDVAPCVILFGFPVPRIVGEAPVQVHWQPLFFDGVKRQFQRHKQNRGKRIKADGLFNRACHDGEFAAHKSVLWGRVTNVSESAMYARGGLPDELRQQRFSICGCGALGSLVAETLARAGVKHLSLFDSDTFEIGNQCRHTLCGFDVGTTKAHALAKRLQSGNLLSQIQGYAVRLPMVASKRSREGEDAARELFNADTVVDCGLSEGGSQWLSQECMRRGLRMVAVFFNLRARMATVCVSGSEISCYEVLGHLYDDIRAGETPFDDAEYNPKMGQGDKILPETGCWQATFPALNNHIALVVSAAQEVTLGILQKSVTTRGCAVVLRRNPFREEGVPDALVELAWQREY